MHEAVEATEAYRVRIKQRIQRLRSLPRVCRQWWKPANEALYRHICISDDSGLRCLAQTLNEDDNLAGQVESLSLQCDEHARLCSNLERTCPVDRGMYGTSSAEICRILACTTNLVRLDILGGWAGARFDWTALKSLPLSTFALEMCIRQERRVMPAYFWDCLPPGVVHLSLAGLDLCQAPMGQEVARKQDNPRLRSLALQDFGGQLCKNVESSFEHVEALHIGLLDMRSLAIVTRSCAASLLSLRYYGLGGVKRTALHVAAPYITSLSGLRLSMIGGSGWPGSLSRLTKLQLCGDAGLALDISWPASIENLEWECMSLPLAGLVRNLLFTLAQPSGLPNLKTIPLLRYSKCTRDNWTPHLETSHWREFQDEAAENPSAREACRLILRRTSD